MERFSWVNGLLVSFRHNGDLSLRPYLHHDYLSYTAALCKKCPWMANYYSNLEASTQIIIFLEMLKFSKMIFLKEFYFFQGQQKKSFKF
jgi:hypothetical protein